MWWKLEEKKSNIIWLLVNDTIKNGKFGSSEIYLNYGMYYNISDFVNMAKKEWMRYWL